MERRVALEIGGLPSAQKGDFVVIDVIRATTTAVTAAASGRVCLIAPTPDDARRLAAKYPGALLAGEVRGETPEGFLPNSPVAIFERADVERPVVLSTTNGTPLMCMAAALSTTFVACLRNLTATAEALRSRNDSITILPTMTRGELRVEDALCAARLARLLFNRGLLLDPQAGDLATSLADAALDTIADGPSAAFLRRTGQAVDLEFILTRVDDVDDAFIIRDAQVVRASPSSRARPATRAPDDTT